MKKAIITKVKSGKNAGQYRFNLVAANGEVIAGSQSESYHNFEDCVGVIGQNFPDFEIVDNTTSLILVED